MGKQKTTKKKGFLDFSNMRIQERLQKSYLMVLGIASVAAVLGVIAIFVISLNYKNAMDNFALPQGEIGQLMEAVSQCRSATRGIIGYDDKTQVQKLVEQNEEYRDHVANRIENIRPTMVTPEGHAALAEIESTIEAYFAIEDQVIQLGTKNGSENKIAAQNLAISQMAPAYTDVYTALNNLMEVNVQKANQMETFLIILEIAV